MLFRTCIPGLSVALACEVIIGTDLSLAPLDVASSGNV